MLYAVTFPAGTAEIIRRQFKQYNTTTLRITYYDESLMCFESSFPAQHFVQLRYLTNVFVVLAHFPKIAVMSDMLPAALVASRTFTLAGLGLGAMHIRTFRIRTQEGASPQALDTNLQRKLIEAISTGTRLVYNAGKGDVDFGSYVGKPAKAYGRYVCRAPNSNKLHDMLVNCVPSLLIYLA